MGARVRKEKKIDLLFKKGSKRERSSKKKKKGSQNVPYSTPATRGGIPSRPSILEVIQPNRASRPLTAGQYLDHPPRATQSNPLPRIPVCSTNLSYLKLDRLLFDSTLERPVSLKLDRSFRRPFSLNPSHEPLPRLTSI